MSILTTQIDRHLAYVTQKTQRFHKRASHKRYISKFTYVVDYASRGVHYVWRNYRYLSVRKVLNIGLSKVEYKLKREKLYSLPYKFKIESTNICNTQCQLCPTGIGLKGRCKGKLDLQTYKGWISNLKWHMLDLDLSMWGDPLIVPEIYDMIAYARKNGIWTYISSNLHAFKIKPGRNESKDQATKLIESGLELLTCSLHAATQETYEQYQPGKKLDEVITKIKHIIATKKRLNSKYPQIQLNYVVTKYNEHEIDAFKALAKELGCNPVINKASYNTRFLGQDKNLQSLGLAKDILAKKTTDHIESWMPSNKEYVLESYVDLANGSSKHSNYNGKKQYDCSWPWTSCVVNWDGSISTCCGSFDPKHDFGKIDSDQFRRLWNSPKYRSARRSFKSTVTENVKDNPCIHCPGYML
ncbi:pyrroloquinoline quinone biosynthesis protein PqqE [Poriferisphaera corsica]|uniref:Pyrroloquinoline quinone biosynthesis protein PqqE n=1 Tax=Poriferisphaera corsica TaxID=2528020 RepID=A0A517YUT9_9BACT|nr:radical SAM protein [Poriferisphaera corsica]QDU33970.1 pyrroloquinoline quinone biosynthesis protein PqqE [Poriferisphaera corsica]